MEPTAHACVSPYYAYWAKSGDTNDEYHLLPYHLLDVAACMARLVERIDGASTHLGALLGIESGVVDVLVWLAGMHDVGKFANSFQSLAPAIQQALNGTTNGVPYNERHDALGKYLLSDTFCDQIESLLRFDEALPPSRRRRQAVDVLLEAVAGHHGRPTTYHRPAALRRTFAEDDVDAARAFMTDWTELVQPHPVWSATTPELFDERLRLGSWALAGWMVLADWLGSNRDFFPFCAEPKGLAEYWQYALERADNAVQRSGVLAPMPRTYAGLGTLFPNFTAASPMQEHAQSVALDNGPQLFVLEDATGSGKTEAALILASRLMSNGLANGVYVALPTTATANGMYARMQGAYDRFFEGEKPSIVLAHSSRKISDDFQRALRLGREEMPAKEAYDHGEDHRAEAICAAWLGDSARKALLAPFGVGTVDQVLLGVLPTSHQSLRLIGMARKVLIIDEVHGYDVYMTRLLCTLLKFHAAQGGSAILLSATLPARTRKAFISAFARGLDEECAPTTEQAFPLATHFGAGGLREVSELGESGARVREQTSHAVGVELIHEFDRAVDHLVAAAASGRCGCWIRNTVDEAVLAHEAVASRLEDRSRAILFHARFALGHRHDIEEQVLRRFGKNSTAESRAGYIVIATQVIEQSLDLDFDHMVTDLAPIDLVVQRAGRLQRHDRGPRDAARLYVLGPDPAGNIESDWYSAFFEKAQWVYRDHAILWLTADLLEELGQIAIPQDARRLIEGVYGEHAREFPATLLASNDEAWAQEMVDSATADFALLDMERGYQSGSSDRWIDDTRAKTRLGDETVRLRLGRLVGHELRPLVEPGPLAWTLSEVSVRANKIGRVVMDPATTKIVETAERAMFDRARYCLVIPLMAGENEDWHCNAENSRGESVQLQYTPKLGLRIS